MFKLANIAVSKNLIIFKIFLEKILKFLLCHQNFSLRVTFLLMLLLNHCFIEKQDSKKDFIWPISLGSFEIVFILLAKIIAI